MAPSEIDHTWTKLELNYRKRTSGGQDRTMTSWTGRASTDGFVKLRTHGRATPLLITMTQSQPSGRLPGVGHERRAVPGQFAANVAREVRPR